ncbi:MAG TPA: ABC transporter ATP-binding protein, partial [Pyrinomonadaceae bacterium]|nr:ABC transporter ATP-binding protein [Pyrinomonadaceae bacterium]
MISATMLSRSFDGVPAVEALSFEIPEGSLFTLLGPNGAGKTTTVRLLLGLIAPDSGTASVAGYELGQSNNALRGVCGLLTETPGFYDRMSAWENLTFFAQLYRIPETIRDQRLREQLRAMNLWERRNDLVGTFSKGMKQKLAIIRAVFHEPKVIFLDEPTAGLDPEASLMVREMISKLKGEG